jgi:polyhydroxyalkanoate synthesis regulator phasin
MMESNLKRSLIAAAFLPLLLLGREQAVRADETQSLEELRNTVINLLDGLVKKGVLTKEQAEAMVSDAQKKASEQAKAQAEQEKAEQGAVRVPYIPEIVKDQIKEEVSQELRADVTKDVVEQAHAEKWGVPGALPSWITNLNVHGDMRFRLEEDLFASDNAQGQYLNFAAVNSAGGIEKAGDNALLNTSMDALRERVRLRLGFDEQVTDGVSVGLQFGYDNQSFAVSTNQTLGSYGQNYSMAVYQSYLRYDAKTDTKLPWMTLAGGRFTNPFYSTVLLWYPDLNFDGTYSTWRLGLGGSGDTPQNVFFTVGAFPLQVVEFASQDKWLYASQLGLDLPWQDGGRARVAAAYYYFDHMTGVRNSVDSTLTNYSAPVILQKGNTLFDISNNPTDPTVNLFALAAEYHELDLTAGLDIPAAGHKISVTGDYVNNIGYNENDILLRTGQHVPKRGVGYLADLTFGSPKTGLKGTWMASLSYRYLQRDAVVDAFADQDFHLGGTDAKGYVLRADWWFRDRTSLSLRYYATDAIDGPPLGIDMIFVDFNASF